MKPAQKVLDNNNNEYPEYAVRLAVAPLIDEGSTKTMVNLTLTPKRINAEGKVVLLEERTRIIRFTEVRESGNLNVLTAFGKIEAALQEFINSENIY